jgi:hypothetical protein
VAEQIFDADFCPSSYYRTVAAKSFDVSTFASRTGTNLLRRFIQAGDRLEVLAAQEYSLTRVARLFDSAPTGEGAHRYRVAISFSGRLL